MAIEVKAIPAAEAAKPRISQATEPTAEEVYLSHSMGQEEVISRSVSNDGAVVTFNHKSSALRVLYRPTTWGWESVQVPASSIVLLLGAGMKVACGDCGGNCSPDPLAPTPNACSARAKFATARCPLCMRLFHDFGARVIAAHVNLAAPLQDEGSESTEINQEAYKLATPEARLKALTDQHILAYHPGDAATLGLDTPDPRLANPRA